MSGDGHETFRANEEVVPTSRVPDWVPLGLMSVRDGVAMIVTPETLGA
jgi:hypothetical protein